MRGTRTARLWTGIAAAIALAMAVAAAPALAAPSWTEIDTVPGQIMDVNAGKVLFTPTAGGLAIKDRTTQAVTAVPIGTATPLVAFLSPHGAIFRQGNAIKELRDGSVTTLVTTGFAEWLKVAGSWAIYSYSDVANGPQHLVRRDLELGTSIEITSSAQSSSSENPNDVATNGDVVYWSGKNVFRFRGVLSTQLTPDRPLGDDHDPVPAYPRTDGTNALWQVVREGDPPNAGIAAFGQASTAKDPFLLDDFTSSAETFNASHDAIYQANNGWIAYTKGPSDNEVVRVRNQAGDETALTAPGYYDLFALSDSGEVMYGRYQLCCGSSGHAYLRKPGGDEIDLGTPPFAYGSGRGTGFYAFSSGGRWYQAAGGSLRRLTLTDAPVDGSETTIDSGPQGTNNPSEATFTFSSSLSGATFQCKLDDGAFEACPSPRSYSKLVHGQHTLLVRAVHGTDVESEPASQTWSVESTPPAAFALLSPANGSSTTNPRPTLSWEAATDAKSGIDHYDVWLRGQQVASDLHTTSFTPAADLDEGPSYWRVDAVDGAGNVRSSADGLFRYDVTPPDASLSSDRVRALTDAPVELSGGTSDDRGGTVVRYQWDVDGDGDWDRDTGADSTTIVRYANPGDYVPRVRETDAAGNAAVAKLPWSLLIRLRPPPGEPGITINDGDRYTNDVHVTIDVIWPPFTEKIVLSNDGGFRDPLRLRIRRRVEWTLDPGRGDVTSRTVYARFIDNNGRVPETFLDDIILDTTAPVVKNATVAGDVLTVTAADRISGVRKMQVAHDRRHPRPWERFQHRKLLRNSSAPLWVRVRDGAGNRSGWRRAS